MLLNEEQAEAFRGVFYPYALGTEVPVVNGRFLATPISNLSA